MSEMFSSMHDDTPDGENVYLGGDPKRGLEYEPAPQTGENAYNEDDEKWAMPSGDITGKDAYLAHVHHMGGLNVRRMIPYEDLSDMAIQMYETEATMYNAQPSRGEM